MKNYTYDLHVHSCLSPCSDNDMTVNNILNMAVLNGIDIIALTDHNSCKNCPAFLNAAKGKDILAIAGMELCTSEEIHIICLFPSLEKAMAFDSYVYNRLPQIKNNIEVYGEQYIIDEKDEILCSEDKLLINAADISVESIAGLMVQFGGFAFPAHVNKASYSVYSVLGFMPPQYGFTAAELANNGTKKEFIRQHTELNDMNILINSDSHYLWEINDGEYTIALNNKSYEALIEHLLYCYPLKNG